jgi:superfamily I DNA/RNA helicase
LIVDYLSCLFNKRNPKAWARLIEQLLPYDDSEEELLIRNDLSKLIRKQRNEFQNNGSQENWWSYAASFLKEVSQDIIIALSPEYENRIRLREIILETKKRIEDLLKIEPQISKALERFYDDQAVRILTIHKSKGLEFDSVVILAVENEIFFGKSQEERCAFFVGISRAKRRLVLTCAKFRKRPEGHNGRWNEQRTIQKEFWGYSQK